MSNRTIIELNHDYCPTNETIGSWATAMGAYIRSGDSKMLPDGVMFLEMHHHSESSQIEKLTAALDDANRKLAPSPCMVDGHLEIHMKRHLPHESWPDYCTLCSHEAKLAPSPCGQKYAEGTPHRMVDWVEVNNVLLTTTYPGVENGMFRGSKHYCLACRERDEMLAKARHDEFKDTVVALWSGEFSAEEKKQYVKLRSEQLRKEASHE